MGHRQRIELCCFVSTGTCDRLWPLLDSSIRRLSMGVGSDVRTALALASHDIPWVSWSGCRGSNLTAVRSGVPYMTVRRQTDENTCQSWRCHCRQYLVRCAILVFRGHSKVNSGKASAEYHQHKNLPLRVHVAGRSWCTDWILFGLRQNTLVAIHPEFV